MQLTRRPSTGKPVSSVHADVEPDAGSLDPRAAGEGRQSITATRAPARSSKPGSRPRLTTSAATANAAAAAAAAAFAAAAAAAAATAAAQLAFGVAPIWPLKIRRLLLVRLCLLLCISLALCYQLTAVAPGRLDFWSSQLRRAQALLSSTRHDDSWGHPPSPREINDNPQNVDSAPQARAAPIISHTLVINLARRTDRWRRVSRHLNVATALDRPILLLGTIERVDAIDGLYSVSDLAQMVNDGRLRQRAYESVRSSSQSRVWGHELTPGAFGCLLSHAKAWERAVALNESLLILEDDVELLSPVFYDMFPRALKELPSDFGLLYLGDMAKDSRTITKTPFSRHLQRLSRPLWGTYAYVVSPKAAHRLLLHIFPADVQTDSYIQQVAELYANDMPNFAVSQDLVFTDNSESRDTDVQTTGVGRGRDGESLDLQGSRIAAPIEYHALYHSSWVNSTSNLNADHGDHHHHHHAPLIEFDSTYYGDNHDDGDVASHGNAGHSSQSKSLPTVRHHDPKLAYQYALEQKLLTRFDENIPEPIVRWLMCIAVAIRQGGGLCFTTPFFIVRSIRHLLADDVKIGVFMATGARNDAATTIPSASATHNIMTTVAYVSPSITKPVIDSFTLAVRHALYHCQTTTDDPARAFIDRLIIQSTLSSSASFSSTSPSSSLPRHTTNSVNTALNVVTLLPAYLFDPLMPLARPCRCTDSMTSYHTLSRKALHACQSRCERLVAPPLAAGCAINGGGSKQPINSSSRQLLGRPPILLHVLVPIPTRAAGAASTDSWNSGRSEQPVNHTDAWMRSHRAPAWAVVPLTQAGGGSKQVPYHHTTPSLRSFCQGIAAVATHGGVYVDARRGAPRRDLLESVLLSWNDDDYLPTPPRSAFIAPATLVWQSLPTRVGGTGKSGDATSASEMRVTSNRNISPSFFAAPYPNHPVAKRLASACNFLLAWEIPHNIVIAKSLLQLQRSLIDDVWAVDLASESAVFR
jgi:GR25 family glycosyltransferase involved in LPS biosynthesis